MIIHLKKMNDKDIVPRDHIVVATTTPSNVHYVGCSTWLSWNVLVWPLHNVTVMIFFQMSPCATFWLDGNLFRAHLKVPYSTFRANPTKSGGYIFITLILTCSIFPEMYERRVRNLWRSQVGPNLENFKESWSVIWHNFHPWKALFALSLIFCWSPVVIRQFIRLFEIFPPEPICFIIHETAPITPWIR